MNNHKDLTIEETFDLALNNHKNNNPQDAQNYYQKVLRINPNHLGAHNNLGVLFKGLGEPKKAKECYEKAIEINPNHSDAHSNLGNIFKELRETQKAKECFEKAIKINPNHVNAHNNLGNIFKKLGDYYKAKECYEKVIEINPNHSDAHNNLGIVFNSLGESKKAKECYEKAIEINPNHVNAHNNLGIVFNSLGENQKAKECFEKAIKINPNYANAHNNLGIVFNSLGENQKAKECYEKAIKINPNHADAHNNLGIVFGDLGDYKKAKGCYERTIEINPNHSDAHNNFGAIFLELGENQEAKECYEKAIEINPNYTDAYFNLHSTSSNIDEALSILTESNKIDKNNMKIKITIAALLGYKGNFNQFNNLLSSPDSNHPYIRSIKWIFSLPRLPKIFFNRWDFFDAIITSSEISRPFYEFGVWNGVAFKYLIKTFKKGFGFDTFTGLPEEWHDEKKGKYSAYGSVPKIEGGEFIVGKFEDTLPNFFSKKKPMASLINFDADLYSSTLCALKYSNKIIDEKTILIFDELIMNDKWEEDEYKALNEFCDKLGYSYEVIAVSFYTKQVAVKLKKN